MEGMTGFELLRGDCVSVLSTMDDASVDLIITDPAYESLEKHRSKGTTTRLSHSNASSNDWFPIFRNDRFHPLLKELYRVLKNDSHLYLFCDQETMFVVKPIAEQVGFTFWKPLVWDKKRIGMGYHYRARYEFILFFEKGKRKLNDLGMPDVLECERVIGGYPTEKPVPLLQKLVMQSSSEGDVVLDAFNGSGATGVAALLQGRNYIGIDVLEKSIDASATRFAQDKFVAREIAKKRLSLFT